MHQPSEVSRRFVLAAGVPAVGSLAGCLGGIAGSSGPEERTYDLTVTMDGEDLAASVDPAGDVADVVQVTVGDTVTFEIANEAGVPVGVHSHANDAELVVEASGSDTIAFETTESMTGRQELEGWVAEGDDEGTDDGDSDDTGNGHGGETTTLVIIEVRPRGG